MPELHVGGGQAHEVGGVRGTAHEREHTPTSPWRHEHLPVVRELDRAARRDLRVIGAIAGIHRDVTDRDIEPRHVIRDGGDEVLRDEAGLDLLALRTRARVDAGGERRHDQRDANHVARS